MTKYSQLSKSLQEIKEKAPQDPEGFKRYLENVVLGKEKLDNPLSPADIQIFLAATKLKGADGKEIGAINLFDILLVQAALPANADKEFTTDSVREAIKPENKPEVKPEVKPEDKPEVKPNADAGAAEKVAKDKAVMDAYRDLATDPTNPEKIKKLQQTLIDGGYLDPKKIRGGQPTGYLGHLTSDATERFLDGQTEAVRTEAKQIAGTALNEKLDAGNDFKAAKDKPESSRAVKFFGYANDTFGEGQDAESARNVVYAPITDDDTKKLKDTLGKKPDPEVKAEEENKPVSVEVKPKIVILDLSIENSEGDRRRLMEHGPTALMKNLNAKGGNYTVMVFNPKDNPNGPQTLQAYVASLQNKDSVAGVIQVKEDRVKGEKDFDIKSVSEATGGIPTTQLVVENSVLKDEAAFDGAINSAVGSLSAQFKAAADPSAKPVAAELAPAKPAPKPVVAEVGVA